MSDQNMEKETVSKILVRALWDDEAGVWVATSEDLPGLIVEAETTDELESELKCLIPQLFIENRDHLSSGIDIPVQLLQSSSFKAHVA